MDHALRDHATYSASAMYRWEKCSGSVALSRRAPIRPPSKWAVDGTEAHELLDFALKNRIWDAEEASIYAGTYVRDTTPEAGERIPSVQVALDYVKDILDSYEDAVLYVEHPFEFPSVVAPGDAYGTCDICIHIPSLDLLYVIDYKHGIGKAVNVVGNPQPLFYATGAVLGSGNLMASTIVLVIIQPRNFHPEGPIRTDIVDVSRLKAFVLETDEAIARTQKPDAPLLPGDHCQFCPANLICPAREAVAIKALGTTVASIKEITRLPDVATLPIDRLLYISDASDMITKFLKDVEDALYQHLMAGGDVPNRKLVEPYEKLAWWDAQGDMQKVAAALMRLIGTTQWDDVYPRQLITITEAKKLVQKAFQKRDHMKAKDAAEATNQAIAGLALKQASKTGTLVMVEASDKRPAVNRAAQMFTGVVALPPPKA